MFGFFKRLFSRSSLDSEATPRPIAADANQWGIPLLDVRALTQHMVTASGDPRMGANSMSHRGSDGAEWIGQDPKIPASTDCHLEYLLDQPLVDGLLFTPDVMEHKWVVYVHQGMIIVVRTWQREVYVVASIEAGGDTLVVSRIRGHFMGTDDTPEFTIATFEYLMRAHCLREHYPVPLPSDLDLKSASVWCCSSFGNIAEYASFERPERQVPEPPRTQHLAAAHRGGPPRPASDRRSGCSGRAVDIPDPQHNTPFTYAVNVGVIDDAERLLTLGADIYQRTREGATPLMQASQSDQHEMVGVVA